jgi:hypothetical protein
MFSLGFGELVVLALCVAVPVLLGGVGGAVFLTVRGRERR